MRRGYFTLLIVGLLISFGCGQPQGRVPPTGEVELIYQCQRFWMEEQFSALPDANLMELFNQTYDVDAGDFNFSFDETSHSTVTECHVYGKISKSGDEYVAYFTWFLDPLGLDFIYDKFEESKTGLSWEGNIKGVPTTIKKQPPTPKSPLANPTPIPVPSKARI